MKKLLLLLLFFPLIGFTQQGTMNAWYTTYGYTSVELKNLINSNSSITFYDEKTYPNHDIIAVMNIIQANVSFKITFSLENKVVNKIKYEFNCRNGYQDYVDYLDGETSILKSLFFECYKQELIWGCNDGSIHTTESKHTPNGFFNFEGTYPNCSPNLELGKNFYYRNPQYNVKIEFSRSSFKDLQSYYKHSYSGPNSKVGLKITYEKL